MIKLEKIKKGFHEYWNLYKVWIGDYYCGQIEADTNTASLLEAQINEQLQPKQQHDFADIIRSLITGKIACEEWAWNDFPEGKHPYTPNDDTAAILAVFKSILPGNQHSIDACISLVLAAWLKVKITGQTEPKFTALLPDNSFNWAELESRVIAGMTNALTVEKKLDTGRNPSPPPEMISLYPASDMTRRIVAAEHERAMRKEIPE